MPEYTGLNIESHVILRYHSAAHTHIIYIYTHTHTHMDLHTRIVVGVCMHLQTFNDSEEQPFEIYTRACVYTRTCLKSDSFIGMEIPQKTYSSKKHLPQELCRLDLPVELHAYTEGARKVSGKAGNHRISNPDR